MNEMPEELIPNYIQAITDKFIEQARSAELDLIKKLFNQWCGEELNEKNAHRVTIGYDERGALYDRHIIIDGHTLGTLKQIFEHSDGSARCTIVFVPKTFK